MRRESGSSTIIGIIAIICIVIAAGGSYFFANYLKEAEIENLKSNYEIEKNQYETEISTLNNQISNLQNTLDEENPLFVKSTVKEFRAY